MLKHPSAREKYEQVIADYESLVPLNPAGFTVYFEVQARN